MRRPVALVLIAGQLLLTSCMSVRTRDVAAAPGTANVGSVAVRVFASDDDRRAGRLAPKSVFGELERRDGAAWVPVFRSLDPAWSVTGLPPGAYRLRFPASLDETGNVVRLDEDKSWKVQARAGRVTEADVVLKHVNAAAIAAGVVGVVVAAVLLEDWLDGHHLPEPPLPDPEDVAELFFLTVDLSTADWRGVSDELPPTVTSHFPGRDALVAARRPRVVFALSEPLNADEVAADAVTVLGEATGVVPGVVTYDGDHWWLVWQPQADLGKDDLFHVTLSADSLEDAAGNEPDQPYSFSFRTAK